MVVFHSTHPFMMRKKFLLTSSASNNIFQTKTQHVFCLWTAVVLGTHGSVGIGMSVGSSGPVGGQVVGPKVVVGKWWAPAHHAHRISWLGITKCMEKASTFGSSQ